MLIPEQERVFRKTRQISLTESEEKAVRSHLQGAVRGWCKANLGKEAWFSARELLGGVNYDWRGTSMEALYAKYEGTGKDEKDCVSLAGKAAGRILKRMLGDDTRVYRVRNGFKTKEYCWTERERGGVPVFNSSF